MRLLSAHDYDDVGEKNQLNNTPSIRQDFRDVVSLQEITSLFRDLIQIPSENPPGLETDISRFIGNTMKKMGLDVKFDDVYPNRPNVYGTLRGSIGKPTLILNGQVFLARIILLLRRS